MKEAAFLGYSSRYTMGSVEDLAVPPPPMPEPAPADGEEEEEEGMVVRAEARGRADSVEALKSSVEDVKSER